MSSSSTAARRRRPPISIVVAVALLAAGATAGFALAKSFTLKVSKNVHVTNDPTKAFRVKAVNVHEAVAVGPTGYAVYTFQGETTHHIICKKTNNKNTNCWAFWPPVSPSSGSAKGISKAPGIKGKLGSFRNHGVLQLTLNGQPLYYFTPDIGHIKKQATGDELKTFGSIWHVVKAAGPVTKASSPQMPAPSSSTTSTTTTSTTPYPYPY
jgi:predicted lipoprotein with Yx(FWY)xxD motif